MLDDLNDHLAVRMTGQHNSNRIRRTLAHVVQELDAVHAGHAQVRHDDVELRLGH